LVRFASTGDEEATALISAAARSAARESGAAIAPELAEIVAAGRSVETPREAVTFEVT
jgi:hypothetical protein